jgi:hypothetical protein
MAFNSGLNRVTLSRFESLPKTMAGSFAHQWLATWGIADRMALELPLKDLPPLPEEFSAERIRACGTYVLTLNDWVAAEDPDAAAFADKLGVALAALVATLTLAPADTRAARAEWPNEHWERWRMVRRIVLGGGVLSGALGQRMYIAAQGWLAQLNPAAELVLALQPRLLMLQGLARKFPNGTVVVVDAGHTAIKRGIAQMRDGEMESLQPDKLLEVPHTLNNPDQLLGHLVEVLIGQAEKSQANQFALSLSMEVDVEGSVRADVPTTSFYRSLSKFRLMSEVEVRLSRQLGYPCQVKVMHEASAAVGGIPNVDAAVLLGTSLGGTFRPDL